jgi:hypothetical protein
MRPGTGDFAAGSVPILEEQTMTEQEKGRGQPDDARHEKARDLAEEALGALAKGRETEADRLIEEAKKLDKSSLVEVVEDLDEDAGSDPDAAKKSPG